MRNLKRTAVRTFLTLFSIAMAVSLYVLLISIGDSFNQQLQSITDEGDVDLIIQSRFAATPLSSSINSRQLESIGEITEIRSVTSIVIGKIRTQQNDIVFMVGVEDFWQVAKRLNLTLTEGRTYAPGKAEAVMASRIMHAKKIRVDDRFRVADGISFQIVGAYDTWISLLNSSIMCSADSARTALDRPEKTNLLFLSLKKSQDAERIIERINQKHPELIAIKSQDFSSKLGSLKSVFYINDIVAFIALMVAIAILSVTFLVAVRERTREIGILSAIGWPRWMIVYIFVAESIVLALAGGLTGFAFSAMALSFLRSAYENIAFYLPESLAVTLLIRTIAISVFIGILGALFPVLSATNKTIIKALKNE